MATAEIKFHCRDCKHWERFTEKNTMGNLDKGRENYGYCSSDQFNEGFPNKPRGLVYWDHEGYSAGFETDQDFGCVNFEGKINGCI